MRKLVSAKEMKEIDRVSMEEFKIPSMVLMERAALSVAEAVKKRIRPGGTVLSVCGTGNNGADGAAAARILSFWGYSCRILIPSLRGRESREFLAQIEIAKKAGISVETAGDWIPGPCDAVIDGIFGVGLSRDVEGEYREMAELISELKNAAGEPALTVAVDMPSGISSDTGAVLGCAVRADVTVTFGEMKLGQALFPGREYCGELIVADIGFPPGAGGDGHVFSYANGDLTKLPVRPAYSNKGTFGKVLVAAGSQNMAGAAYFSALAAIRCGAGLVKILTTETNREILQTRLPEAILSTYDPAMAGEAPEEFQALLRKEAAWADVIVLGPGLGKEPYARRLTETILSDACVPIIMDADAINLAAEYPELKTYFTENIIVTPHLGEMARLTGTSVGELKKDLIGAAVSLTECCGVTCVLKDAATVVSGSDGQVFVNRSGSPAMAKGGSGDVLTGVIAGLIACGMEECEAASFGVWLHGLAGEEAERRFGTHSVLAGELADCLGAVLKRAEEERGPKR